MYDSRIRDVEYRIQSLCRKLGTSWVVAVSGGSDSVGLLRLLHDFAAPLGLHLSVAHLNHGTRAEAAQADADLVAGLADSLKLPFDLGRWRPTRSAHFEVDARRARYAWLTEIARAREAAVVAVGHTSDDQAETILHRILRGTGTRGLAGIPETRTLANDPPINLARPLLGMTRQGIRDYLARIGQDFREDASNEDTTRTRSRIRHDLIPRLRADYNPRIVDALNRLGQLAAASNELIADRLAELEATTILEANIRRVLIDRRNLGCVNTFLGIELIRRAWGRAGWPEREMSTAHWERLHAFASRDVRRSRMSIGSGIDASLVRDHLVLTRLDQA
ncbi:MAG: tRNA lysidine(34) synthetase TilS [Planctomycetes bacterium SCN 63-9]|nr:MAG: tRNA lysidine(34) synthetase TilS [Planctomycetes bacterium SCN 63-9]